MIKYAVKVTDENRTWYCKDNGKISTVTEKTNEIPTDEEASFDFDEIRQFGLLDSARVMSDSTQEAGKCSEKILQQSQFKSDKR